MKVIPNRSLDLVKEFHQVFGHPINPLPVKEGALVELLPFRLKLMLEELTEIAVSGGKKIAYAFRDLLDEASADLFDKIGYDEIPTQPNMLEVLDGLADLRYVADGTVIALGLEPIFDDAMEVVQASNMSKACKNEWEANQTAVAYTNKGVDVYQENKGDYIIVKRRSDDKILKNINYVPAKKGLEDLLDR